MIEIESMGNKLKIRGNVKSISHYNDIKSSIDQMIQNQKDIVVELLDSISLTSLVIGYFTKIVNIDEVVLRLHIGDERLFELLDDLGLIQVFNVKMTKTEN